MKDAEKFDVPVVNEDFLEAVKNGGATLMIKQHSIAAWGTQKVSVLLYLFLCQLIKETSSGMLGNVLTPYSGSNV